MATHTPPLKVWIWVACIFLAIQGIVYLLFTNMQKHEPYLVENPFDDQIEQIRGAFEQNESAFKVVIIGSSFVAHGVACPTEIQALFPDKNIQLHKIWNFGNPLQDLIEQRNLIELLLELKPDLVCIQTAAAVLTVYYDKKEIPLAHPTVEWIKNLAATNRLISRRIAFQMKQTNFQKEGCYPRGIDERKRLDTLNFIPRRKSILKREELEVVFQGLGQLQAAGIELTLVDMPNPQQVQESTAQKKLETAYAPLLHTYEQELGMEHWVYTGQALHFRDFIDARHLHKSGRIPYTKWLLKKIEQKIKN